MSAEADQVTYFENVDKMLDTYVFETDEEKQSFMESVESEILRSIRENKTVLLHHIMSRVIEKFIRVMAETQRLQVFLILQGKWMYLAEKPASSYVLETLIKTCETPSVLASVANEVLRDDPKARLVWSRTGSHVVRALITRLVAEAEECNECSVALQSACQTIMSHLTLRRKSALLRTFPVAVLCLMIQHVDEVVKATEAMLSDQETLELLVWSPIGSRVVQSVLEKDYEGSCDIVFPSSTVVQSMLGDISSMRVVATGLRHAPAGKLFTKLWKKVAPCLPVALNRHYYLIITSVLDRSEEDPAVTKSILDILEERMKSESSGTTYHTVAHYLLASPTLSYAKAAPAPGNPEDGEGGEEGGESRYHRGSNTPLRYGSLILAGLLKTSVKESVALASVPSDVVRSTALTPDGSKLLQTYLQSVAGDDDVGTLQRFLRRFRKHILELALDSYGSRLVEVMLSVGDRESRPWIEAELTTPEGIRALRNTDCGRVLIGKFKLEHKRYSQQQQSRNY